ncbi:hypothetical protein GCM10022247_48000 [Allokutzneria multivorans]|uniref:Uncharacterized protein n=1 Tax=Allokutzneria multivorans TaxID=1142134 RepID=A0ABP7SZB3_9PSEU
MVVVVIIVPTPEYEELCRSPDPGRRAIGTGESYEYNMPP